MGCRLTAKLLGVSDVPPVFANVTKIIITGGAGICHAAKSTLKQKIFKVGKKLLPDSIVETMKRNSGSDDYRNATPIMRESLVKMVNEDLSDYFPHIAAETLLIWGANDDAAPLSDGKIIEELMPNAGLAVINGVGHYAFLENERLFYEICKKFF
jgi:pimeloyl-ACP methyl ester carboxylesterase